jgi:hypothetical protein
MLKLSFVLNLEFGKFEFVSDLVLRISNLQKIGLAKNLDITTSYLFE